MGQLKKSIKEDITSEPDGKSIIKYLRETFSKHGDNLYIGGYYGGLVFGLQRTVHKSINKNHEGNYILIDYDIVPDKSKLGMFFNDNQTLFPNDIETKMLKDIKEKLTGEKEITPVAIIKTNGATELKLTTQDFVQYRELDPSIGKNIDKLQEKLHDTDVHVSHAPGDRFFDECVKLMLTRKLVDCKNEKVVLIDCKKLIATDEELKQLEDAIKKTCPKIEKLSCNAYSTIIYTKKRSRS